MCAVDLDAAAPAWGGARALAAQLESPGDIRAAHEAETGDALVAYYDDNPRAGRRVLATNAALLMDPPDGP